MDLPPEVQRLAGRPKDRRPRYFNEGGRKRMERDARRFLWNRGITAKRSPRLWAAALAWAEEIANSYAYRQTWPLGSELAAYFLMLLAREFVQDHAIRRLPQPVRRREELPRVQRPALPQPDLFTLEDNNHE